MGRRCVLGLVCVASLVLGPPAVARAGSFYLLPRGARGVAQGGAMVAGSDDPGALWYNPAGLVDSGGQLLFDLVLPLERFRFTRINSGGETEPTVEANAAPLPIPAAGVSHPLMGDELVVGVGFFAPTAALLQYPRGVDQPGTGQVEYPPQGYSIMSMEGSALVFLSAGVGYRPHPAIALGASFDLLVGRFEAEVLTYLADPGSMGPPESEQYARPTTFGLDRVIRPTGKLGATLSLHELPGVDPDLWPLRLAASFTLPVTVQGEGSFDISLPNSGLFADAELSDDRIFMAMDFPWILRTALEVRPVSALRAELAFTYEAWSAQDAIDVESDIRVTGVPVLESYTVGDLELVRRLKDTWSLGLGVEYALGSRAVLRLGSWYETSSMSDVTMSPLIPDTEKLGLSLGAGVALWPGLWLDVTAGYMHMWDRNVPFGTNEIYRLEALRPPLAECQDEVGAGCPVALGDGVYELSAPFVGAGLRWAYDGRTLP